jgi:hypothetical protein
VKFEDELSISVLKTRQLFTKKKRSSKPMSFRKFKKAANQHPPALGTFVHSECPLGEYPHKFTVRAGFIKSNGEAQPCIHFGAERKSLLCTKFKAVRRSFNIMWLAICRSMQPSFRYQGSADLYLSRSILSGQVRSDLDSILKRQMVSTQYRDSI